MGRLTLISNKRPRVVICSNADLPSTGGSSASVAPMLTWEFRRKCFGDACVVRGENAIGGDDPNAVN